MWLLGTSHNLHISYGSISIELQVEVLARPLMVAAGPVVTIAAAFRASQPWATVSQAAHHENNKCDKGHR